ncbi:MAG: N-acyl homoserine lactonase family protein [Clostridia bacterium]
MPAIRLYTLDCGRASFQDMGFLSDTGDYDGKPGKVADPCFVIRHPKGILLWDTGLPDKMAESKGGIDDGGTHMEVTATLAGQLKALGLTPADITYVAFSHFHFDHTGNANLFGSSTWIINRAELAWAESKPGPFVQPDSYSAYKSAKTQMIDGDYDVFGDRSVRILKAPGHTPGHQVLMLRLEKSGTVVLSGDLYHLRENRTHRRVPPFNTERADTLASMDRIERIVKNTKARFVVQHDSRDFAALPKFPAYLE